MNQDWETATPESEDESEGSGCFGEIILALVIYGIAVGIVLLTPGAENVWGMELGTRGSEANWITENSEARLLAFAFILLLLSPLGWGAALFSFILGTILTIFGWWLAPADVWGLPFPDWYLNHSAGMYWFLWLATLGRALFRF